METPELQKILDVRKLKTDEEQRGLATAGEMEMIDRVARKDGLQQLTHTLQMLVDLGITSVNDTASLRDVARKKLTTAMSVATRWRVMSSSALLMCRSDTFRQTRHLVIETFGGDTVELETPVGSTTYDVKWMLEDAAGVPLDEQHLLSGTVELQDEDIVLDDRITLARELKGVAWYDLTQRVLKHCDDQLKGLMQKLQERNEHRRAVENAWVRFVTNYAAPKERNVHRHHIITMWRWTKLVQGLRRVTASNIIQRDRAMLIRISGETISLTVPNGTRASEVASKLDELVYAKLAGSAVFTDSVTFTIS